MKTFVVLAMIFCHIIDDYKLQQITLANLKQKVWWQNNAPDELYKNDYIVALLMHAMSWSFMILLPVAVYKNFCVGTSFVIAFLLNTAIHAYVDDLKANRKKINLIADQSIHMFQIFASAAVLLW